MTIITENEKETQALGESLAPRLPPGSVVALHGDLGAGKTAFVRGLAKGMGISQKVSSPTYTMVNEYAGKVPLFHFDMYRLSGPDELFFIGWDDYLDRGGIFAVEWSERIEQALGSDVIRVRIEKLGENRRTVTILFPEEDEGVRHENFGN